VSRIKGGRIKDGRIKADIVLYDAASGQHKGHYTAILPEQRCHLDRRGGNSSRGGAGVCRHPETRLSTSQPDDPQ
jgi:hypothetical protein